MTQEPAAQRARGPKLVAERASTPGCVATGAHPASPATAAWDFGTSSSRTASPHVPAHHQFDSQAAKHVHAAGVAAGRQPPARGAAATATPPAAKTPASGGLFKAVRTHSGHSLTGLLKRPAPAAQTPSPMGMPLFEVRGASMMPPEPQPAAAAALAAAAAAPAAQARPATQHAKPVRHVGDVPLRAAYRTTPSTAPPTHHTSGQRQPAAVVAAHGLDLCSSPAAASTVVLGQKAVEDEVTAAASSMRSAPHPMTAAQRSSGSGSGGSTYGSEHAAATTVHQNPLYVVGNEQLQQQQQQQRLPPPVRVPGPGIAASTPSTPQAAVSLASSGATPGASPQAYLQAASNMTIASDSRPISPGPYLSSNLASSGLPDSRPVSPQFMDNPPPTPGSFALPGSAAAAIAAATAAGRSMTPIKTLSAAAAAAMQTRSMPASPVPPAAMGAAPSTAAAGQQPAATGAGAAAFRLPIFNQDGRLVGYKQNSNLIPGVAASASSAPSSPSRSACFLDTSQGSSPLVQARSSLATSAAQVAVPPSDTSDFREAAADPYKGFSVADNMVPGYLLGPVLGKGGFCSVRKALHELTGQVVACKIIEKGKLKDPKDRDRVDRECRVMRNLSNHVTIIKLYEYVETRDYVYIMMEAAKRGSLLDYVREKKKLPEDEAVTIFQQLLHSLQFCHRKDVVHRDIKLENILIDSAGHMKLIDFGLCGYYVAGKRLRCHCGSPSYAAPEIVARKEYLGPPVDVWSLGIVLFAMLAGYLPFHAKEKKHLSEKILAGVYKPASWMSSDAQDLLSRMLTLDPDQRITLEEVWQHPWVASAPRWEPPGVGAGRLYRSLTDPTSGAVLPDEAVMAQLEALGADTAAIRRALRSRECNSLTASYHLMFEARVEAQRQAAAREREVAADRAALAAKQAAVAASSADWQWDFAAINAAAAGSHASAGSSSLRASGSPARPRTAALPVGSPSRFGQEAAAAGYMSSARAATAAAATTYGWPPSSQAADRDAFTIKAVHAPDTVPAAPATGVAMATAAVVTTTAPTILSTSEGASPTKAPRISPLPTVLSPKQLPLGGRASSGGEPGPLPQAA